ncbi:MAG: hypothetical protein ACFFEF_07575 [Candidatus Thorarchaeota archaeon]
MTVFLRANAFIGMVAAVAEGFKSEVGGLVFGDHYYTSEKYIVEVVIPLQTTKRSPTQVHFHPKRTKRVLDLWNELSPLWYLGSFHSHPEYGGAQYPPEQSEADRMDLKVGDIEIIMSIWEATRKEVLGYIRDGKRISGAVGDYYIQISAWHKNKYEEINELELWCPYINIINESRERGIVSKWGRLFERHSLLPETKVRTLQRRIEKYENQVFRNPKNEKVAFSRIKKTIRELSKEIQ